MFNPSRSLLGESQQFQHQWTMVPLPGASPQVELEDGETVATSPLDPMAGPTDPQVLHPASQVIPTYLLYLHRCVMSKLGNQHVPGCKTMVPSVINNLTHPFWLLYNRRKLTENRLYSMCLMCWCTTNSHTRQYHTLSPLQLRHLRFGLCPVVLHLLWKTDWW